MYVILLAQEGDIQLLLYAPIAFKIQIETSERKTLQFHHLILYLLYIITLDLKK